MFQVLSEKKIGIVAHFYMDPEVQGVLTTAAQRWPHIHISDSLVMADKAVKMVEEGCTTVAVLGVDFMSENVRAILDEAGHRDAKVILRCSSFSMHDTLELSTCTCFCCFHVLTAVGALCAHDWQGLAAVNTCALEPKPCRLVFMSVLCV